MDATIICFSTTIMNADGTQDDVSKMKLYYHDLLMDIALRVQSILNLMTQQRSDVSISENDSIDAVKENIFENLNKIEENTKTTYQTLRADRSIGIDPLYEHIENIEKEEREKQKIRPEESIFSQYENKLKNQLMKIFLPQEQQKYIERLEQTNKITIKHLQNIQKGIHNQLQSIIENSQQQLSQPQNSEPTLSKTQSPSSLLSFKNLLDLHVQKIKSAFKQELDFDKLEKDSQKVSQDLLTIRDGLLQISPNNREIKESDGALEVIEQFNQGCKDISKEREKKQEEIDGFDSEDKNTLEEFKSIQSRKESKKISKDKLVVQVMQSISLSKHLGRIELICTHNNVARASQVCQIFHKGIPGIYMIVTKERTPYAEIEEGHLSIKSNFETVCKVILTPNPTEADRSSYKFFEAYKEQDICQSLQMSSKQNQSRGIVLIRSLNDERDQRRKRSRKFYVEEREKGSQYKRGQRKSRAIMNAARIFFQSFTRKFQKSEQPG